ncbi:MAG: hypothetical protein ACW98Y_10365 [Candidatus Thorarchaeota archaeon]|jgi:hypothetical protein
MIVRRVHRIIGLTLFFVILVGPSLIPLNAAAAELRDDVWESKPIPTPDMPKWTEQPQNQSVEFGDTFSYIVNITGTLGYWWFVSDNIHFRINAESAADHATINSNGILGIGDYYLKITVWDQTYDRLEAEIWISVRDTVYPNIEGPDTLEYMEGERNHSITWVATDANPYYYVITKSGASMEEGHWLEPYQEFTFNLGFLPSGTFIYRLQVWDHGNNTVSWSAVVHVRQNETAGSTDDDEDPYARTGEIEQVFYVPKPDVMFIELFAIVVLSGLTGLVLISAIATKRHEFGFA